MSYFPINSLYILFSRLSSLNRMSPSMAADLALSIMPFSLYIIAW